MRHGYTVVGVYTGGGGDFIFRSIAENPRKAAYNVIERIRKTDSEYAASVANVIVVIKGWPECY